MSYQTNKYAGVTYHHYRAENDEVMVNYLYGTPTTLKNWNVDKCTCLVGGSNYFINDSKSSRYGEVIGRVQNLVQPMDNRPNSDGVIDLSIMPNNEYDIADLQSWDMVGARFGMSGFAGIVEDGKPIEKISTAFENKWKTQTQETIIGFDKEGRGMCTVIDSPGLNCTYCQALAITLDYWIAMIGDGGGSSIMYLKDYGYVSANKTRKLPVAIAFIKTKETKEDMKLVITPVLQKLAIRDEYVFRYSTIRELDVFTNHYITRDRYCACGNIVKILEPGESIEIIGFVPEIAPDGWQWVKVRYNDKTCYCQYDSMSYLIEEKL